MWLMKKFIGNSGEKTSKPKGKNSSSFSINSLHNFTKLTSYSRPNVSYIRMTEFSSLNDIESIQRNLKNGNIMLLNTEKLLQTRSILELKSAIDQLRRSCKELGGSIGRLGNNFLILTPNPFIRIGN